MAIFNQFKKSSYIRAYNLKKVIKTLSISGGTGGSASWEATEDCWVSVNSWQGDDSSNVTVTINGVTVLNMKYSYDTIGGTERFTPFFVPKGSKLVVSASYINSQGSVSVNIYGCIK